MKNNSQKEEVHAKTANQGKKPTFESLPIMHAFKEAEERSLNHYGEKKNLAIFPPRMRKSGEKR